MSAAHQGRKRKFISYPAQLDNRQWSPATLHCKNRQRFHSLKDNIPSTRTARLYIYIYGRCRFPKGITKSSLLIKEFPSGEIRHVWSHCEFKTQPINKRTIA